MKELTYRKYFEFEFDKYPSKQLKIDGINIPSSGEIFIRGYGTELELQVNIDISEYDIIRTEDSFICKKKE